jgi:probable F420-dependent oxidoreductase
MKYSISLFPLERWSGVDEIVAAVQAAERLGFAGVGLAEHLFVPSGNAGGDHPSALYPDNFALGAVLARETSALRIMLSALVVPYRHPLVAAKGVATLDWISDGRLDVTTGVGWLTEEFNVLGVPVNERGARTDDYLRAMVALWTQEEPAYEGRFVSFKHIRFQPKCVQRPHAPLLIGGSGEAALRRVMELGAGWAPMLAGPDVIENGIRRLGDLCTEAGRDVGDLRVFTRIPVLGGNDAVARAADTHGGRPAQAAPQSRSLVETLETVEVYRAAGVGELGLSFPWRSSAEYLERLEWFASEVMPQTTEPAGRAEDHVCESRS